MTDLKRKKHVLTTAKWIRRRFPRFTLSEIMKIASFLHGQGACPTCKRGGYLDDSST